MWYDGEWGGGACSDVAAPLGLRWWPNWAHVHGSTKWCHLNEEGDWARLTLCVSVLGKASRWLAVATVLPCNSGVSHGVAKGPPAMKRLPAAATDPPQPPRCLQLQRNRPILELFWIQIKFKIWMIPIHKIKLYLAHLDLLVPRNSLVRL
jgi:hypothetical protein